MLRLTVLRHAKSSWDFPDVRDLDRPLSGRGHRDAALMGRVCADKIPAPDLIVLSPSRRTRETVKAFTESWGLQDIRIIPDGRLYLAGLYDWNEVVSEFAPKAGHILGCAHQPGIGDFVHQLCAGCSANVPTAAVFSFTVQGPVPERGGAKLVFSGFPRDFREDVTYS